MIELRADGSIPGPDQYGRIYKVVDPMTGIVAYNMRMTPPHVRGGVSSSQHGGKSAWGSSPRSWGCF